MFARKADPALADAVLSMSYIEIYKDEVYDLLVNRAEVRVLYPPFSFILLCPATFFASLHLFPPRLLRSVLVALSAFVRGL
jgi:hypothetical protein